MNNISIVGRISRDIQMITTSGGVKLARFNVAVKSEQKDENGERMVDFFPCIAWREMADNINKFFKKGSAIGIVGSMNSRRYKKPDENATYPIWELNVKSFYFVGFNEPDKKKTENKEDLELTPVSLDDDNLPF